MWWWSIRWPSRPFRWKVNARDWVCAFGMERVVLLMEALGVIPDTYRTQADVYLMPQHTACGEIRKLARRLRQEFPSLRVMTHIGGEV